MKCFRDFLLTEAKVAPKNVDRTADTVVRYFNNKLKRNYKLVDAYDAIKGSEKIRQGLYKDESGSAIGVNFKTSGEFYSISVWDKLLLDKNGRYNQPKREIKFESSESFAKVLPNAIDELFGTGEDGEVSESITINEVINTYKYNGMSYNGKRDTALAMKQNGESDIRIMRALDIPANKLRKFLQGSGIENKEEDSVYEISVGEDQKIEEGDEVDKAVKKFEETEYADPNVVFDQLDVLVKSVGDGVNTALLITGQGGIGKSFGVGRVLKEVLGLVKGEDYVIMKGSNSSFAMYRFLYNNYDKTIIFDDCDSVFADKDSLNILKAVLDTGAERIVSWDTAGTVPIKTGMSHDQIEQELAAYSASHGNKPAIPSQFEFEGSIIFISNMTRKQIESRDAALLTRCLNVDITLSQEDTINRIKTCLPGIRYYAAKKIEGQPVDITNERDKAEVMEYMMGTEFRAILARKSQAQVSFRTLINLCKLKASDPVNWKSCVELAI